MCGISGLFLRHSPGNRADLESAVSRMMVVISHRGPNDSGLWVDERVGIALGHRRLSILDLSASGHQPMVSHSGRYVISYNGEIYNFKKLRGDLEGTHHFTGYSDTEVILAAISEWGLKTALKRFNGMFAFALWDRQENTLHLIRDRLGIKPLYFGWADGTLLFGSELKALKTHSAFRAEIDRDVLALYLRLNYVPSPYSIYKGFFKLPPGTVLSYVAGADSWKTAPIPYWSAREVVEHGMSEPWEGTTSQAADHLEKLLSDAIGLQMVSDVPLGAFLSGGVDSSTVVALMQAQSQRPVKTFTIGFSEEDYNEAINAKAVAKYLGTDHTELYIAPEEIIASILDLPKFYDEPFADSSQVPTFLVSKLARRYVTVSLSGDGGDELFTGYNRYLWGQKIWEKLHKFPQGIRLTVAKLLVSLSISDEQFSRLSSFLPSRFQTRIPSEKARKLIDILGVGSQQELYWSLVSHWKDPASVVIDSHNIMGHCMPIMDQNEWSSMPDFIHQMMYLDTITYLPDDILTKLDRASMSVSLESRVPFLDHRVVEFAWRLPIHMKINQDQGKWLLRQVLYKYVPERLIERPKMGFSVPIGKWLRGTLKHWAESLLDESVLRKDGYFYPEPILQKWREHLQGKKNWQNHLWSILMFQSWLHHGHA